jgi:hypothetical protein
VLTLRVGGFVFAIPDALRSVAILEFGADAVTDCEPLQYVDTKSDVAIRGPLQYVDTKSDVAIRGPVNREERRAAQYARRTTMEGWDNA